jgi:thiosulfate/3-mercaptopyruvate sulfurtransferase
VPTIAEKSYHRPDMLRDTAWLAKRLDDPNLCVIDCDSLMAYQRAHIPGARSLAAAVTGPTQRAPHLLKHAGNGLSLIEPEQLVGVMAQLGIGDDTEVYAYDGHSNHFATRLWFVLHCYGFDRVRIIDGGWAKWLQEGRVITRTIPASSETLAFTPRLRQDHLAGAEEMRDSFGRPDVAVVDARTDDEYEGRSGWGTTRAGRIPGARHIFYTRVLDPGLSSTFLPVTDLRELFERQGITPDKEALVYCFVNIRATLVAFALALLGYDQVRCYEEAWAEWGNRPDLPIEPKV